MTGRHFQTTTCSPNETQKLGETIGNWINDPLVIGLSGDLGSGKTAFVQGLAAGLDVPGHYYITSPTFTLINEYPGRFPLFHIDLYRLDGKSDLEEIGLDELLYDQAILAIEWVEKVSDSLPTEHLTISFEIADDDCRRICLNAYGHTAVNLIKALEWSRYRMENGD